MKSSFILVFVCLVCIAGMVQLVLNTASKYLNKNNVRARIHPDSNKFKKIYSPILTPYEVPAGKSVHVLLCRSTWIGGLDAGGQLHVAANNYKQSDLPPTSEQQRKNSNRKTH